MLSLNPPKSYIRTENPPKITSELKIPKDYIRTETTFITSLKPNPSETLNENYKTPEDYFMPTVALAS